MKKIIVLFTILLVAYHAFAQEKISGYVEDSLTHNRLANVSVTLLRNGKPLKFTRSKEDGTFQIPIVQKQVGDMLQATYMGYKKRKTAVSSGKETVISMASTAFVLKEVQVKGSRITPGRCIGSMENEKAPPFCRASKPFQQEELYGNHL